MPCYSPITGYVSREVNPTGKRSIVFDHKDGYTDMKQTLPCGRCIGCRLEKSRQWAVRCIHEAQLYDENCFITLTFDEYHIDNDYSLRKADFQKFIKRLRKYVTSKECLQKYPSIYRRKIRYYHCGEYGELYRRPHHHACIFNFDFPDKEIIYDGKYKLYTSALLSQIWTDPKSEMPYGYSTVGEVTYESAAYVARYIIKKITGDKAEKHYQGRVPEYTTMSRRPGIASEWFKKYTSDVYPSDMVVVRDGLICKPPKYYDKIYDTINPQYMARLKHIRSKKAQNNPDNTYKRLRVRQKVAEINLNKLKRGYENDSEYLCSI